MHATLRSALTPRRPRLKSRVFVQVLFLAGAMVATLSVLL